jgi:hypothetical protein
MSKPTRILRFRQPQEDQSDYVSVCHEASSLGKPESLEARQFGFYHHVLVYGREKKERVNHTFGLPRHVLNGYLAATWIGAVSTGPN